MAAILPLTNQEVFPSYAVKVAGTPFTPTTDVVVIAVEDFVAADALELSATDGNAGELLRSVLLSGRAAQNARPVAERPTMSVVLQDANTTSLGLNPELDVPQASNVLQLTTTFLVGSAEGGSIAPEPTV